MGKEQMQVVHMDVLLVSTMDELMRSMARCAECGIQDIHHPQFPTLYRHCENVTKQVIQMHLHVFDSKLKYSQWNSLP